MNLMWFALSILALLMQTTRRSAEKRATKNINSMALTWLQQAVAMPLIIVTLFFAKFYWPSELSAHFWQLLIVYVAMSSLDVYCYFRAISIADISYVAPLLTLVAVGNIIGAYFVLGQVPSVFGVIGALLIMTGAYLNNLAKRRQKINVQGAQVALGLVLVSVVLRSYYANIEVSMLRLTNPTSYNFYSSLLCIPFILLISSIIVRQKRDKYPNYWSDMRVGVRKHIVPLAIVGVTYTINLLATYQAKLIGTNAGYVGAIKSASVLPLVLIGVIFFKEKVVRIQWIGLGLIIIGLVAIAVN
jgi:drug/metabolite transporter (DMT)-like permease